ncbi:ribosome-inactivating family protein [Kitasatospora sp. NPDC059577]|uniref:ribosome-inactivating family protein n=1 Tax=unclassified Kitasatospora TaxID=2633591 RepID=UPI00369C49AC
MHVVKPGPRAAARPGAHRILSALAVLLAAVAAMLGGTGAAHADTPEGRVSHVWLNLSGTGNQQASQYGGFISSLQNAAGHYWYNGVAATQVHGAKTALIRADLNFNGEELRLWFSPNDLYLRGFTNHNGDTWQFNDGDYNLAEIMENLSRGPDGALIPPQGQVHTLSFGSSYGSMSGAADGIRRENLPISYSALYNHAYQLQYGGDGSSTAHSLLFLTQYTSEATRFWDVYGVMVDIMRNGNSVYPGLPSPQVEIESDWRLISDYARNLYNHRNPPAIYLGPHAGSIANSSQLTSRVRLVIGDPSQINPTGDWWHTEL